VEVTVLVDNVTDPLLVDQRMVAPDGKRSTGWRDGSPMRS
jgi:hypothetical protein